MPKTREERVRERAYEIWEREGRAHGLDAEHWRRAEAEIDAEERRTAPTESASAQIAGSAGATTAGPAEPEEAEAAPVRSRPADAGGNRSAPADPNGGPSKQPLRRKPAR